MTDVRPEDIRVRVATSADAHALLAANRASVELHHPWITTATDEEAVRAHLERAAADDVEALLGVTPDGAIVATYTFSQIFRRGFQNAYLGFAGVAGFTGRGLVEAGLRRALDHAFGPLALHRVEANVQPGNLASKRLVERVGFRLEGHSPRYLHIDGAWRDHDRYALTVEEWPPSGSGGSGVSGRPNG